MRAVLITGLSLGAGGAAGERGVLPLAVPPHAAPVQPGGAHGL